MHNHETHPAGIEAHIYRRRWIILGILNLSLLMVVLGNTVINVALPTFVRELGATGSELQWIVDAYSLVFGGTLLTMGALGDRFGRRGALQTGLVVFGLASITSLFASEPWHLITTRALMGLGGALVMPATLSLISTAFPPHERGKAMGIWAAFAGIGGILGPITSGFLLEHFAWSSIFAINLPVVALALAGSVVVLPTSRDPEKTPLDPLGATLSIVALSAFLFAVIEGPERGWTDVVVLGSFATSLATGTAFLAWQRKATHPMLDLGLFRRRGLSIGSLTLALTFFAMFAMMFVLTQYLQFVRDYSPLETGIRLLPLAAGMMMAAPNSDRLVRVLGRHRTVALGLALVAGAIAGLSMLEADTPYWGLGATLVATGIGMGLAMAPSTTAIMRDVPGAKAGVGSAMNDVSREVGGAVGVGILGSVLSEAYSSGMEDSLPGGTPQAVHGLVTDSIGSALAAASRIGGEFGELLAQAARSAFVDAIAPTFLLGAIGVALTAALAHSFMPHDHGHGPDIPGFLQRLRTRWIPHSPVAFVVSLVLLVAAAVPAVSISTANEDSRGIEAPTLPEPTAETFAGLVGALGQAGADSDGDGLPDAMEAEIGTDPGSMDTDRDGLPDGLEVSPDGCTDPTNVDSDGDGLPDGAEAVHRTDPCMADSDGDGLPDGAEVGRYGTDPLQNDTDSDGLPDGAEVGRFGTDPLRSDTDDDWLTDAAEIGMTGTDPLQNDTDSDGLPDGAEAKALHTNPLDPDTDGDGLTDGEEVNVYHTTPQRRDSDGDFYGDGTEVRCGSMPQSHLDVPLPTCALPDETPAEP